LGDWFVADNEVRNCSICALVRVVTVGEGIVGYLVSLDTGGHCGIEGHVDHSSQGFEFLLTQDGQVDVDGSVVRGSQLECDVLAHV
jgi:hypothetical protein